MKYHTGLIANLGVCMTGYILCGPHNVNKSTDRILAKEERSKREVLY